MPGRRQEGAPGRFECRCDCGECRHTRTCDECDGKGVTSMPPSWEYPANEIVSLPGCEWSILSRYVALLRSLGCREVRRAGTLFAATVTDGDGTWDVRVLASPDPRRSGR